MAREDRLTLDMLVHLTARFGPASKVAHEMPGWLEAVADVECPERPLTGSAVSWSSKVRTHFHGVTRPDDVDGDGAAIEKNCALLGAHFGLSEAEVLICTQN